MSRQLYSLLRSFAVKNKDTADWEKAVRALLVAILLLGILTLWQVRIIAPTFLFNGAVAVYAALLILTGLTWFRLMWIYLIDGLLGLGLVAASLSQPEHFALIQSGIGVLPTFIMIVGDVLALTLGVISVYVFWGRFSPTIETRLDEHGMVHANCAPNAPCRTMKGYRV